MGANWERSLGGPTSNRFSELTQITPANVSQLEVAWTYHSKDGTGNIQCNPIVVDGVLYTPTPGNHIAAVDARTVHGRLDAAARGRVQHPAPGCALLAP